MRVSKSAYCENKKTGWINTRKRAALGLAAAATLLNARSLVAATYTWANVGTDWTTNADWTPTTGYPGFGVADTAQFRTAATVQPNLASNVSVGALFFLQTGNLATGYTIESANSSVLSLTAVASGTNGAAVADNPTSGTNTINLPLNFAASGSSTTQYIYSNNSTVFAGSVSATNGLGTLALQSTGTIAFNVDNSGGLAAAVAQTSSNTIVLGNAKGLGTGEIYLQSTGGKIFVSSPMTLSNAIGLTGVTVDGTSALTFGGTIDLLGSAGLFSVNGAGGAFINNVVSDDGGKGLTLTTVNSGVITINSTNTYTGGTSISGSGSVSVSLLGAAGSAGNLGAGSISLGSLTSPGALYYTGAGESTSKAVYLTGTTGAGGGLIDSSGSGPLAFTSNFITSGVGAKTLTLQGSNAGANTIGGTIVDSSAGSIALTKSGTGTWILTANNTYTGLTTVSGGLLQLGATGSIGGGGALTTSGTGSFDLNGVSQSLSTVTDGGTITNSNATPATLAFTGSASAAGVFSGNLNLTLTSTGTTTALLSASEVNTGNINLNANNTGTIGLKTLVANNTGAINNGGTGAGTVTISGGIGSNVTAVNQNSATSALTISTTSLTVNSAGTTLSNSSTALFTLSAGVSGTGALVLNNNGATANGILISTGSVNFSGGITNSGTGSGAAEITSAISSSVTSITQNSSTSGLTLGASATTFAGSANVQAGTLTLISPTALGTGGATLYVTNSPTISLTFSGSQDVSAFYLNGTPQSNGTYNGTNDPSLFTGTGSLVVGPVPEPATMGLLALGGVATLRRRRRSTH